VLVGTTTLLCALGKSHRRGADLSGSYPPPDGSHSTEDHCRGLPAGGYFFKVGDDFRIAGGPFALFIAFEMFHAH
jgi:hypothetical protein